MLREEAKWARLTQALCQRLRNRWKVRKSYYSELQWRHAMKFPWEYYSSECTITHFLLVWRQETVWMKQKYGWTQRGRLENIVVNAELGNYTELGWIFVAWKYISEVKLYKHNPVFGINSLFDHSPTESRLNMENRANHIALAAWLKT